NNMSNNIPEIYGNSRNLELIQNMRRYQRIPHACLFYGEPGSGRKTLAEYFAMTVLCTGNSENYGDAVPCGTCRNCRKILRKSHPDLILPEHSGKKQGFSVETVREVCQDALTAPNDGDLKIYLFTDCDNINIPAQNTLLKLTEEPPEHVILLFTAQAKSVFLETMLSRMMQIAVNPCSRKDCETALLSRGISPEDAVNAVRACGGNIGQALQWLADEDMQMLTRHVTDFTNAVFTRKHYEILKILHDYEKDRQKALEFLRLVSLQFRDAMLFKYCPDVYHNPNPDYEPMLAGCDRNSAKALSTILTASRAIQLQDAVRDACTAINANVSTKLALATFGGRLLF
ncbi:MAG: hypothetical protein K2J71_00030, partial [Oscillospiraceae bacterium]|nr:hypothetical protein [Oscillospiraceae bacterium]